jgi:hypothetical protein
LRVEWERVADKNVLSILKIEPSYISVDPTNFSNIWKDSSTQVVQVGFG